MKTLTHIIPAALCAMLAYACTKTVTVIAPDNDGQRIMFSTPQMTVGTKSAMRESLESGDVFGVIGYCIPYSVGTTNLNAAGAVSSWSTKRNLCPPNVFFGDKVTVTGSGCIYDMDGKEGVNNPKYWYRWDAAAGNGYGLNGGADGIVTAEAGDYRYSFFAYWPYPHTSGYDYDSFNIVSPASETAAGAPIIRFSMPQEGSAEDFSDPLDHMETPDAMIGVIYNAMSGDQLRFQMYHLLTGLGFEVNNFSDLDLVIHSIKLRGSFYKEVEVNLTASAVSYTFPSSRYTGTYTIYDGGETGMTLEASAEDEAGTSSGSPIGGEYIMLISGTGTYFGDDVMAVIDYTFDGNRKSAEVNRPGTFTPQPGIRYTAQFNFVHNAFVLQFVVNNGEVWEDGEMDDENGSNDDVIFQ